MSDAVMRVSAEISESEISRSRDFQADSALASGRASGNQPVWSRFDFPGGGIRVCRSATKSGGLGDSATLERTRSERGVLLTALP